MNQIWETFGWLSVVAIPGMVYVSGDSVTRDQWLLRAFVVAVGISGVTVGMLRRWRRHAKTKVLTR
jgi:hypothetical protein